MRRLLMTAGLAILATVGLGQTTAQAGFVLILIVGNDIVDQVHEGEASNMIVVEPDPAGRDVGLQENTLRGVTPDDTLPIAHDLNVFMGISPQPF